MSYLNLGLGAPPVVKVVRQMAKTVPPMRITIRKNAALSRKVAPAKGVMRTQAQVHEDAVPDGPGMSGYEEVSAHSFAPMAEAGIGSSKRKRRRRAAAAAAAAYQAEWNGMKKRVADAIESSQPTMDKLNATFSAFANQIDSIRSLAGNTSNQAVLDAINTGEESRNALGELLNTISGMIDKVNKASDLVRQTEASFKTGQQLDGRPALGQGSLAEEALKGAASDVVKLVSMVSDAGRASNALKSVLDNATRIVNREAQSVLDQAAVVTQQQQQAQLTDQFTSQAAAQQKAQADAQLAAQQLAMQQAQQQQAMQQAQYAEQMRQQQIQQQQAMLTRQSYDFAPSYNPPQPSYQPPTVSSISYGDAYANQPGTPDFFSESPVADPFFAAPGPAQYAEGFADYVQQGGMGADANAANLAKARALVQSSIASATRTVEGAKAAAEKALAEQNKGSSGGGLSLWKKLALAAGVGLGGYFGFKAWKKSKKGRR